MLHWMLSWIPRPYILADYRYGARTDLEVACARIIDTRHTVMVEADDEMPVMVDCTIRWMTPRAFERVAEFEGF